MSLARTIRRAQLARAGALVKTRPVVVEPMRIVGMPKAVVALVFWIVAAAAEVSR